VNKPDKEFDKAIREAWERAQRALGQAHQKYREGYDRWIESLKRAEEK
jgi:hypothetical protein